jgi:hypothetical protein
MKKVNACLLSFSLAIWLVPPAMAESKFDWDELKRDTARKAIMIERDADVCGLSKTNGFSGDLDSALRETWGQDLESVWRGEAIKHGITVDQAMAGNIRAIDERRRKLGGCESEAYQRGMYNIHVKYLEGLRLLLTPSLLK